MIRTNRLPAAITKAAAEAMPIANTEDARQTRARVAQRPFRRPALFRAITPRPPQAQDEPGETSSPVCARLKQRGAGARWKSGHIEWHRKGDPPPPWSDLPAEIWRAQIV
jgi:hypothetical protein